MRNSLAVLLVAFSVAAFANDHNNVDAGRPLLFDDAFSIAFGERVVEIGLMGSAWRDRATRLGLVAEFKYGFAKNQDFSIGFHPSYTFGEQRAEGGEIELGHFHGIQREIDDSPALGYRVKLAVPTGPDARGVKVGVRAIATKQIGNYDKLHVNVDVEYATDPHADERDVKLGAVVGYSVPLGYPRRFDRTLVADVSWNQAASKGQGGVFGVGLGVRQQIDAQSVFDIGLRSDILGYNGAERRPITFVVGFSKSF